MFVQCGIEYHAKCASVKDDEPIFLLEMNKPYVNTPERALRHLAVCVEAVTFKMGDNIRLTPAWKMALVVV